MKYFNFLNQKSVFNISQKILYQRKVKEGIILEPKPLCIRNRTFWPKILVSNAI